MTAQALNLNAILLYCLVTFFVAFVAYPYYIQLLIRWKAGKQLRENDVGGNKAVIFNQLHAHKAGTPTMGGALFLIIMLVMLLASLVVRYMGRSRFSLFSSRETYVLLAGFFGMGIIGIVDDILNIQGKGKVKGLSAIMKLLPSFLIAGGISYRFYAKLDVDWVMLWPLVDKLDLGIWFIPLTFLLTLSIVNAINITDGLDGLAGGLLVVVLTVLGGVAFLHGWNLATTIVGISVATLSAFLRYNAFPAKVFMGDSGALALGGLIATLVYLLNMKISIFIPFMILFGLFWLEMMSSFLQIVRKKYFKRKLFVIAPFHHLLQYRGMHETSIVMKFRLVQRILATVCVIMLFYQIL